MNTHKLTLLLTAFLGLAQQSSAMQPFKKLKSWITGSSQTIQQPDPQEEENRREREKYQEFYKAIAAGADESRIYSFVNSGVNINDTVWAKIFGYENAIDAVLRTKKPNMRRMLSFFMDRGAAHKPEYMENATYKECRTHYICKKFSLVIENGDSDKVKLYLETESDLLPINETFCNQETPLIFALRHKHHDNRIIDLLLEHGAHVNEENIAKILSIIHRSDNKSTKEEKEALADKFFYRDKTINPTTIALALLTTQEYEDRPSLPATLKYLVNRGADIHARYPDGETMLIKRIKQNNHSHKDEIYFRVQRECTLDMGKIEDKITTKYGELKKIHETSLIGYLLKTGIDPSAQDYRGNTALHYACDQYNTTDHIYSPLELLMDCSSNPAAVNKKGQYAYEFLPVECINQSLFRNPARDTQKYIKQRARKISAGLFKWHNGNGEQMLVHLIEDYLDGTNNVKPENTGYKICSNSPKKLLEKEQYG